MLAVVLSFDQFPLRLLGCYGNTSIEMPCLNRIAAESVVFDQHFGEDFSRSPEGHAWWSGSYHFPRAGTGLISRMPSLPELLTEAGVENFWLMEKTAATVPLPSNAPVTAVSSFAELIHQASELLDEWSNAREVPRLLWLKAGGLAWDLKKYQDLVASSEAEDEPVPEGEDLVEMYRLLMNDAVQRCDAALEPLWKMVLAFAENRKVLFIFTSSQGLSLGEREQPPDSESTWAEEIVHLPLVVHHSEIPGGERRSELTQSIDLPATLLDFFALDSPRTCEGESFLPILRGEELPGRDYLTSGCHGVWESIRTRDFHFVRLRGSASSAESKQLLFMKPDDVWDWHDVAAQEPELTEILSTQLDAFLESAKHRLPVSEQTTEARPNREGESPADPP